VPELDDPRRQARQREIIDCAKEVFAEHGYHTASISEIITRAGIARGTFYLYFTNKQTVFDSILDEALCELRARITPIEVDSRDAEPPQIQLRQNLVRVLDYVLSDRSLTQILLNHKQSPQAEVAERVNVFFTDVTDLISSSLQHGIAMKLIRPCQTELVAAALVGAVRGVIEYFLNQDQKPDIPRIVDELITFVLRSVFIA
jgi:AcrR family transcriptional regulator